MSPTCLKVGQHGSETIVVGRRVVDSSIVFEGDAVASATLKFAQTCYGVPCPVPVAVRAVWAVCT